MICVRNITLYLQWSQYPRMFQSMSVRTVTIYMQLEPLILVNWVAVVNSGFTKLICKSIIQQLKSPNTENTRTRGWILLLSNPWFKICVVSPPISFANFYTRKCRCLTSSKFQKSCITSCICIRNEGVRLCEIEFVLSYMRGVIELSEELSEPI